MTRAIAPGRPIGRIARGPTTRAPLPIRMPTTVTVASTSIGTTTTTTSARASVAAMKTATADNINPARMPTERVRFWAPFWGRSSTSRRLFASDGGILNERPTTDVIREWARALGPQMEKMSYARRGPASLPDRAVDFPGVRGVRLPTGRALSRRELQRLFAACAKDVTAGGPAGCRADRGAVRSRA